MPRQAHRPVIGMEGGGGTPVRPPIIEAQLGARVQANVWNDH